MCFCAGPITADVSASFDDYWNSSIAYPLQGAEQANFDAQDLDETRDDLRQHWRTNADPYNAKPLNATPLAAQIANDQLGLTWAPAEFKADSPEQDRSSVAGLRQSADATARRTDAATRRRNFSIISPYFVPHDAGVKALGATDAARRAGGGADQLARRHRRGRRASRLQPVSRAAAAKRRRTVRVQAGAEHGPRVGASPARSSRASLHAKTYVIDRKILVIGSMNLDPRSANLNTELALVIHSPALAGQVAADLRPRHRARGRAIA